MRDMEKRRKWDYAKVRKGEEKSEEKLEIEERGEETREKS